MTIFSKKPEETSQTARKTFSEELRGNEIADLRSKARRRLIGASVIALVAVIVLPLIFDGEPVSEQRSTAIELAVVNNSAEEGRGAITIVNNPPAVEPPLNNAPIQPPVAQNNPAVAATPPATNQTAAHPVTPPTTAQNNVAPTAVRPTTQNTTQPTAVAPTATKPTAPAVTPPATAQPQTEAARPPVPAPPQIAPGTVTPPAQANTNTATTEKNYRVQFGAYATREKAEEVRLKLLMTAQVDAQIESASSGVFRVRSKKLVDKVEAEKIRQDVARIANIESSLVTK